MSYTYQIPVASSTSPQAVVALVRYRYPNTWPFRRGERDVGDKSAFPGDTRNVTYSQAIETIGPTLLDHLVVSIDVQSSKHSMLGSASVSLVDATGEILKTVSSGDWIFIWMVNDQDKATALRQALKVETFTGNPTQILDFNSGFKFGGKISAVREQGSIAPDGKATRRATLTCNSFSEFNTSVYFLPYYTVQGNHGYLWMDRFFGSSQAYTNLQRSPQNMISFLSKALLGYGSSYSATRYVGQHLQTPNMIPRVPTKVSLLFGNQRQSLDNKDGVPTRDVTSHIFGIQNYSDSSTVSKAFNPSNIKSLDGGGPRESDEAPIHYLVGNQLRGKFTMALQPWQNTSIMAIMQTFLIPSINEMYTSFRIGIDGLIRPTLTVRQIPLSTDWVAEAGDLKYDDPNSVTKFSNLPRWKATPASVISWDVARNDAMRTNFVNVTPTIGLPVPQAVEKILSNYLPQSDTADIWRNGLHAQIVQANVSHIESTGDYDGINELSKLVADRCMGGHLKLSGSISMIGIQEPIVIGDNFEFDGVVFHIEQCSHSWRVTNTGSVMFRTILGLTNGLSADPQRVFVGVVESPSMPAEDLDDSIKMNTPQSSEVV